MNKLLKEILFSFIVFFTFSLLVNAGNYNNTILPRDIIIGNTTFRSGTWISSNRAAKAGSLYTKNTNDINVITYFYLAENKWYILDDNDNYRFVTGEQLQDILTNLNIYYINNEPINITYSSDELLSNRVSNFFEELLILDVDKYTINDEAVSVDYQNKTITCPFGKEFTYKTEKENVSVEFVGKCYKEFDYSSIDNNHLTPIKLKSIKVSDNELNINKANVSVKYNGYSNEDNADEELIQSYLELNINNKLIKNKLRDYSEEKTYYAVDLIFDDNSNVYAYDIFSNNGRYVDYIVNADNSLTLFIDLDMYLDREHKQFVILDNSSMKYIYIDVITNSLLTKESGDFKFGNIVPSQLEDSNNGLINNIDIYNNTVDIVTNGLSNKSEHNGVLGSWYVFDITDVNGLNLEYLDLELSDVENYSYEVYNDKVVLWVDFSSVINDTFYIDFKHNLTNGNNHDYIQINVMNNYVTYKWDDEKDSVGQKYLYIVNGNGLVLDNYSLVLRYNNSDEKEIIPVYTEGVLLIPELVYIEGILGDNDFTYIWDSNKDSTGQQYLYIVNRFGNYVNGKLTVSYKNSDYTEVIDVSKNGVLLIKDLINIENVEGVE